MTNLERERKYLKRDPFSRMRFFLENRITNRKEKSSLQLEAPRRRKLKSWKYLAAIVIISLSLNVITITVILPRLQARATKVDALKKEQIEKNKIVRELKDEIKTKNVEIVRITRWYVALENTLKINDIYKKMQEGSEYDLKKSIKDAQLQLKRSQKYDKKGE